MNIKKKLSALRRADAVTEQKITASYPPDWDMEAVFQKSYRKFKEMETGEPVVEPKRMQIQMHRSWVTAACLLLAVGIAGAAGLMKLAMREPDTVPLTSTATSIPIETVYTTVSMTENEQTTEATPTRTVDAAITQTTAKNDSRSEMTETEIVSSPSSTAPQTVTDADDTKQESTVSAAQTVPAETKTVITVTATETQTASQPVQTTTGTQGSTSRSPVITTTTMAAAITVPQQESVLTTITTEAVKQGAATNSHFDNDHNAEPPADDQPDVPITDDPVPNDPQEPIKAEQPSTGEDPSAGGDPGNTGSSGAAPELAQRFQIKDQGKTFAVCYYYPESMPQKQGEPVVHSSEYFVRENADPGTTYIIESLTDGTLSRCRASCGGEQISMAYKKSEGTYEEVMVNDCPGCLITTEDNYELIWCDGTYFIFMYQSRSIPLHLIQIAETITIKDV